VAPHGAGLANMVVSRPDVTVVEAKTRASPHCYAHLANRLNLTYFSACSSVGSSTRPGSAGDTRGGSGSGGGGERGGGGRNPSNGDEGGGEKKAESGDESSPHLMPLEKEEEGGCPGDGRGGITADVERVVGLVSSALALADALRVAPRV
jgi:hypothetical protein